MTSQPERPRFPTIHMKPPVENPCPHAFPYTVTDGKPDIEPCKHCGTPWERRNDDYPNAFVTWSIPEGVAFEPAGPRDALPSGQKLHADPGRFAADKEQP